MVIVKSSLVKNVLPTSSEVGLVATEASTGERSRAVLSRPSIMGVGRSVENE